MSYLCKFFKNIYYVRLLFKLSPWSCKWSELRKGWGRLIEGSIFDLLAFKYYCIGGDWWEGSVNKMLEHEDMSLVTKPHKNQAYWLSCSVNAGELDKEPLSPGAQLVHKSQWVWGSVGDHLRNMVLSSWRGRPAVTSGCHTHVHAYTLVCYACIWTLT